MVKRIIAAILSGYFVICFLLAVTCAGIVIADCVNKVSRKEFILLPEFNVTRYKEEGPPEEWWNIMDEAYEYWTSLENAPNRNDIPTRLLSIGIAVGICNLGIYYMAYLFRLRLGKVVTIFFYIESGIFLLLKLMLRIYVHNCYAEYWFENLYGMAFITWREAFIPLLVASVLTFMARYIRQTDES